MNRTLFLAGLCAAALVAQPALGAGAGHVADAAGLRHAAAAPTAVNQRFSDTYAYGDLKLQFVYSCYLIKHGDDYMMWDTGHAMTDAHVAPKVEPGRPAGAAQAQAGADQVCRHQPLSRRPHRPGGSFPQGDAADRQGRLGRADQRPKPPAGANAAPFAHWISGEGKVEPVPLDKDVFGDGTVIMLYTPGHTPGHHSLLVKLPQTGAVLITGDLAHFHENYDTNGVPPFNTDRAETLASLDRIKKIAANAQGHRHHPARRARHRQAAGLPGGGKITRQCEAKRSWLGARDGGCPAGSASWASMKRTASPTVASSFAAWLGSRCRSAPRRT